MVIIQVYVFVSTFRTLTEKDEWYTVKIITYVKMENQSNPYTKTSENWEM